MLQLNEQDKKTLKLLKLQHDNWKTTRLIIAVSSSALLLVGIFVGVETLLLIIVGAYGLSYSPPPL